jgi:hypothetical protein
MAKLRLHISTQPNKTSEVAEFCWRNQPQLLIALRTRSAWKPSNRNSIYCFRRSTTDNCEVQFSHAPPVCAPLYMQLGNYCGLVRVIFQVALCFNFLPAARVPVGHVLHPATETLYLQYDTHTFTAKPSQIASI